jgi:hypothetical protein
MPWFDRFDDPTARQGYRRLVTQEPRRSAGFWNSH